MADYGDMVLANNFKVFGMVAVSLRELRFEGFPYLLERDFVAFVHACELF
jgi:hypothetical protein